MLEFEYPPNPSWFLTLHCDFHGFPIDGLECGIVPSSFSLGFSLQDVLLQSVAMSSSIRLSCSRGNPGSNLIEERNRRCIVVAYTTVQDLLDLHCVDYLPTGREVPTARQCATSCLHAWNATRSTAVHFAVFIYPRANSLSSDM